jgi:hypothetical protein
LAVAVDLFDPGDLDLDWDRAAAITRARTQAGKPDLLAETDEEVTVTAIKQTVTIQPGGRIEVVSDELPEGRQAEVIILVDPSRSTDSIGAGQGPPPSIQGAGQSIGTRLDAGTSQHEGQDREYPTADFIKPTEYDWNIDKFIAEQAVREYLRDSHADH